jgi:hypothetical protein
MGKDLVDDLVEDYNLGKEFQLTEYETGMIKEFDALLQFHIHRSRMITAILTHIAMVRLGYTKVKDGYDLQYGIETETEPYKLRVKEIAREM